MNIEDACSAAMKNRAVLMKHDHVSCYQCCRTFPTLAITEWTDDGQTALCPHCDIDSVLPGIIDTQTLAAMNQRWFCRLSTTTI